MVTVRGSPEGVLPLMVSPVSGGTYASSNVRWIDNPGSFALRSLVAGPTSQTPAL